MGHLTSPHQTLKAAVRNMPKLDMKTFHTTKCLKDVEGCLVVAVVIAHIISCYLILPIQFYGSRIISISSHRFLLNCDRLFL